MLNKFHIADSVEFMKTNIENNYIDLTVTSPPYDDLREYNGFKFDYKTMLEQLYRVTKVGGIVVWVVGDKTYKGSESGTSFKQALYAMEIGFNLHDTMIYEKSNSIPLNHNRYEQTFEYMFILSKDKPKTFNAIMVDCKYAGTTNKPTFRHKADGILTPSNTPQPIKKQKIKDNIWRYVVGANKSTKDKIAYKHPAIFPDLLAQDHILSWSNEGDIVFDPMCGSGTVCKMAKLNNRNYIGIDMSKEYINDICIPRIKEIESIIKFI